MSKGVDPVTYRGGHLQIIACAGAGKTEAIALRAADILAEDFRPESIIAFTFTDKAGAELRARVEQKVSADQRLGPAFLDRLHPMFVGTMHSYCMQMLQQNIPELAMFEVLDDHRLTALLNRESYSLRLRELTELPGFRAIDQFRQSVDVLENELLARGDLSERAPEFARAYDDYIDLLQRYNALTYGQMIVCAVEVLSSGEPVAERILAPLRHIIVDEYQDTNPAQERLAELLSSRGAHVCVVGDDDQSIYQWRGATVENILRFSERYPDVATCELPCNRRSQPDIVRRSRSFIEDRVSPRLPKSMEAARGDEGGRVIVWQADRPEDEAWVLAETIHRLHENAGFKWSDMAILTRSVKTSSRPIMQALESRGVPLQCTGSSGLFMEPDAQQLARLYSWLGDREWSEDQWSYDAQPVDLASILRVFKSDFDLNGGQVTTLAGHLDRWKAEAQDDTVEANLVDDFYALLSLLGVQGWRPDQNEALPARFGALARFSALLADFEHATKRTRRSAENGNMRGGTRGGERFYRRFHEFMQFYALSRYEGFVGEETMLFDAVTLSTVHGAKGLQWPIVFVPGLIKGRFPPSRTGTVQDRLVPGDLYDEARYAGTIQDEARLFYVAMTRARDGLYLSRFCRMKTNRNPSPFFELVGDRVGSLEQSPLPLTQLPSKAAASGSDIPIITFTDLASYDSCPHGYRLRTRLGFQPLLARELGYGKAVHHILRRIADETQHEGRVPDASAIGAIFEQEFFLPFANKPAYEQMRRSAERLVGEFVEASREDLERVWETERPFELHLTNATVAGRADVILDRENGRPGAMAIVDYKTAANEDDRLHRLQLQIYTAAGRREGLDVQAAYLMDLQKAEPRTVNVTDSSVTSAEEWATESVERMLAEDFPTRPGIHCEHCDVGRICGACAKTGARRG